jgi:hypothetical protein
MDVVSVDSGVQLLFDSAAEHRRVTTPHTIPTGQGKRTGRYHLVAVPGTAAVAQRNGPGETDRAILEAPSPCVDDHADTADSVVAERLWDALHRARTGETQQSAATLEDAAFRFYLPMARSLAHLVCNESIDRFTAEQAAELGLAHAVLAWRQRSSAGFRRFARAAMMRQINTR